jgi:Rod binding domain-containing protein
MSLLNHSAAATYQLPVTLPPRGCEVGPPGSGTTRLADKSDQAAKLRETFTQFVGEAFFGQMIKAMRSTVGKPAYFHGGRGEEAFQGQLDQKMAEELAQKSASRFAEPMFERQFPKLAQSRPSAALNQLEGLRRF